MKRLFLGMIIIVMACSLFADAGDTSNVAEFISKKGSLLIKEFHSIASYKSMYGPILNLDVVFISDATSNVTVRGLRIEAEEKKSYGTNTSMSFLDVDEVESLIAALDYVIESETTYGDDRLQPYRELEYSSKDSFSIGVFIDKAKYTAFARVGRVGQITLFIKYQDLPQIKRYIESALVKLNQ